MYNLDSDKFSIDSTNGSIFTAQVLDREHQASHIISISAIDGGGRQSAISVTISVLDVNDNAPVFSQSRAVGYANEGQIGFENLIEVHITDADQGENSNIRLDAVF